MAETALYPAVKTFLERAGFDVKGEVGGCDVVAIKADAAVHVTIAELKTSVSLDLVLQAVDRLRIADEVWIAVPATRRGRDRDRRIHRLCRLLGIGLLAVSVTGRNNVEILADPGPYKPRPDARRRSRLIQEHTRRIGDPTQGGITRQPIMTAYRQQALACAAVLSRGDARTRDLRRTVPDAGRILLRNVYGWFERIDRGVYRLTPLGEQALTRWPPLTMGSAPAG